MNAAFLRRSAFAYLPHHQITLALSAGAAHALAFRFTALGEYLDQRVVERPGNSITEYLESVVGAARAWSNNVQSASHRRVNARKTRE
jgi:hypothetical protein